LKRGYIQDKIELPYLIINIGLRYDYGNANVIFRSDPLDPNSLVTVESDHNFLRFGIDNQFQIEQTSFFLMDIFSESNFEPMFENSQYDLNVREPLLVSRV